MLVQKRIGEEIKKKALKAAMDHVKKQMEAQQEPSDTTSLYKEFVAQELEAVGRVLTPDFYISLQLSLPDSLQDFYSMQPAGDDSTEQQTVLAMYGGYIFAEIAHAKRMHALISA